MTHKCRQIPGEMAEIIGPDVKKNWAGTKDAKKVPAFYLFFIYNMVTQA